MFTHAQYCHHDGEAIFVSFPLAPLALSWTAVYLTAKIKIQLLTNYEGNFRFWGTMGVYDLLSTLHLKEQTSRVFDIWGIFLWWTREVWLSTVVFSCERGGALLLPTDLYSSCASWAKKSSSDSKESGTKTVTEPKDVRGQQGALSSLLIHHPFQLFVVLWWCVSCTPLLFTSSPRHETWWYSLVPKKEFNSTHPLQLMS